MVESKFRDTCFHSIKEIPSIRAYFCRCNSSSIDNNQDENMLERLGYAQFLQGFVISCAFQKTVKIGHMLLNLYSIALLSKPDGHL